MNANYGINKGVEENTADKIKQSVNLCIQSHIHIHTHTHAHRQSYYMHAECSFESLGIGQFSTAASFRLHIQWKKNNNT